MPRTKKVVPDTVDDDSVSAAEVATTKKRKHSEEKSADGQSERESEQEEEVKTTRSLRARAVARAPVAKRQKTEKSSLPALPSMSFIPGTSSKKMAFSFDMVDQGAARAKLHRRSATEGPVQPRITRARSPPWDMTVPRPHSGKASDATRFRRVKPTPTRSVVGDSESRAPTIQHRTLGALHVGDCVILHGSLDPRKKSFYYAIIRGIIDHVRTSNRPRYVIVSWLLPKFEIPETRSIPQAEFPSLEEDFVDGPPESVPQDIDSICGVLPFVRIVVKVPLNEAAELAGDRHQRLLQEIIYQADEPAPEGIDAILDAADLLS